MVDAMYTANAEGIETIAQLERRLNDAGAAYSRARSALKKMSRAKEKMETLHLVVSEYSKMKDLAERLLELTDGPEKNELQEKHKDVIRKYKDAKAVMYRFGVTEERQIEDFIQRYDTIQEDVKDLEKRLDESKETYRKLKKLHYNTTLAENAQYCYGPNYSQEQVVDQLELTQRQVQTEAEKDQLDEEYELLQQEALNEINATIKTVAIINKFIKAENPSQTYFIRFTDAEGKKIATDLIADKEEICGLLMKNNHEKREHVNMLAQEYKIALSETDQEILGILNM